MSSFVYIEGGLEDGLEGMHAGDDGVVVGRIQGGGGAGKEAALHARASSRSDFEMKTQSLLAQLAPVDPWVNI